MSKFFANQQEQQEAIKKDISTTGSGFFKTVKDGSEIIDPLHNRTHEIMSKINPSEDEIADKKIKVRQPVKALIDPRNTLTQIK